MTSKQRQQRFAALEAMGCIVCRNEYGTYTPAEIHHLRGHQWSGMGRRANDEHTIPLCPEHHRTGGYGVAYHAGAQEWERLYGTQGELLEQVNELLREVA